MSIERTREEVSQAAEKLKGELRALGISASVGKSALQGANVELRVNLRQPTSAQLPNAIDGIPVYTHVTGENTPH